MNDAISGKLSKEQRERFDKIVQSMVDNLNRNVLLDDAMIKAADMVKARIPGTRKGSEKPAYLHSLEVRDILSAHSYDATVAIAGLLHDIVEDGNTSFTELEQEGFSPRIIELVQLCSHDASVKGGDARWICMMEKLIRANDKEAWAVKMADLMSNFDDAITASPERCMFIRKIKTPLLLSLTKDILGETSLWQSLHEKTV